MKKTILYLTLLTLALMSPARAGAEEISESNLVWTYSDGTLTFSKGTGSGNAVIPDIDYSSTDHWRAYAGDVTSVVIGDGITTIGLNAFNGFSELKTVSFGKDVQTIDQYAFSYCGAMETITLPASLTKICETAFGYCYELKSINIPDAVTDIEQHAFNECEKLEEVTIGNNVANIGHYAFQNCRTLKTVYMKPATPPTLGCYDIFYNCGGKPERIIVPDGKVDAYKEKYAAFDWKDKIVDEVTGLWNSDGTRDGTAEHPYLITTTMGLDLLASKVNSGTEYGRDDTHLNGYYFELGADIAYSYTTDCDKATSTENNYTAIGCYISDSEDYYFKGHFDGCSHTVSGIRIYKGSNGLVDCSQGLFGQIGAGGSVSHLTLDDARITGKSGVGGIVGLNEDGTITDCHVTEKVYIHAVKDNPYYHGGIVGYNIKDNKDAIVSGCTSRAHITLSSTASDCLYYGGIVGFNSHGTIQDCLYLGGEVGGNSDVGAIAGDNIGGTIKNCYFKTLEDGNDNGNSTITAMGEDYNAIGYRAGEVTETNNAYARTITLEGDVAIGGTANDYAKDVENPAVHLTTYTPSGGNAPTAMKYATADGKAWLFAQSDAKLSLGFKDRDKEGYLVEEKATKTDGGSDVTSTVYTGGTLTVPEYDVTFSATGEDVWGVSGDDPNNGSKNKPYTITSPGGFKLLAKQVNSGANEYSGTYFALGGDVEFEHKAADEEGAETENNYTAIGYYISFLEDYYFKGHFDGRGHTVKGIRIYKGSNGNVDCSQGLFGQIDEGGSVSHVILDDARITGYKAVGGIAGANYDGTITDCHVTENVYIHAVKDNADNHGGIVGYNYYYGAIVSGCTSRAHITIVSTASDCHNYGGIAGYNIWGTIQDCLYLGGQVGGNNYVGAIAGYNSEGTIENCYFKTLTDGSGNGNSNVTAMDENYPAIGGRDGEVTESNNAYARTITLANDVALGGTTTNYAKDVVNPSQYLTAYATDGHGFALAHTIVGTETTTALYSVKDATVSVKPSGQLDDGITPTFIVTKSQGGTVEVSSDNSVYTFLMPADNVSVSMLTGVKVTVGAQSFATYYSSQAVSLGSGQTDCALYTLSSVSTTAVTLSEISGVASKETPLLVWNGSDTPQDILLSFAPAPATTTEHADEFVGTLAATDVTTLTNATVYVLYNNMFMRATTGSIPANRAYIALSAGSNARALSIGTVTGITPPLTPPLKGAGNAADGLSKGAGNVYDMQGRKVSDGTAGRGLRKGVYITNGKKIIITNKK